LKEKYELAYEDYLAGMKQKEIAKKYGTTINTVKSWSRRYEWSKKKKKGAHQNKSVHTKKECKKIAEEIVEISELDEERQLFCIYYLKYHNKVKAYQKVKPHTPYNSACVMASRWSKQPAVIEEINRLKKELYEDALLDPQDIVQKYIDIAFADINDYLEYGREEVPVIVKNPITGEDEILKQTVNMVKFKESAYVDGTILSEVKKGKDGASIKLSDRMKALDWLSKHMNLATEEQRAKIDLIKAQTRKIAIDDEKEEIEDDGFLDALNASAKEDWEDEED
jgi:phage terminase small subunit